MLLHYHSKYFTYLILWLNLYIEQLIGSYTVYLRDIKMMICRYIMKWACHMPCLLLCFPIESTIQNHQFIIDWDASWFIEYFSIYCNSSISCKCKCSSWMLWGLFSWLNETPTHLDKVAGYNFDKFFGLFDMYEERIVLSLHL